MKSSTENILIFCAVTLIVQIGYMNYSFTVIRKSIPNIAIEGGSVTSFPCKKLGIANAPGLCKIKITMEK